MTTSNAARQAQHRSRRAARGRGRLNIEIQTPALENLRTLAAHWGVPLGYCIGVLAENELKKPCYAVTARW